MLSDHTFQPWSPLQENFMLSDHTEKARIKACDFGEPRLPAN